MRFNIFKLISDRNRAKKAIRERLYYLRNIKPVGANKALDECTVTKK